MDQKLRSLIEAVSTKDAVPTYTGCSILSRIKRRGTQEVHEFSIAQQPLVIEGPVTTLRDASGLSIDVDWDLVNEYPNSWLFHVERLRTVDL